MQLVSGPDETSLYEFLRHGFLFISDNLKKTSDETDSPEILKMTAKYYDVMNVYNTCRSWSSLQFTTEKYIQTYKKKLKFCNYKAIHSQKRCI